MKKYGSRNAKASVEKKTVRKMLNIPFCAYCVQISTTRLLSATDAFSTPSSLMFADSKRVMEIDRKSTRLNSSHGYISYAVFCLKKKIQYYSRLDNSLLLHR